MLHIVNKSPFQSNALDTCLRLAQAGHAVLLIEDGVYAATRDTPASASLAQAAATLKIFALKPDLDARGVTPRLSEGIQTVDYGGFVDLTLEYPAVQSWL